MRKPVFLGRQPHDSADHQDRRHFTPGLLPRGQWYDFFSGELVAGEREIDRPVDLATMPIYVRAGAILPLGPVKQYTSDNVEEPLSIRVYPGADGHFMLYEDDGTSFNYRSGDWMGIDLVWDDRDRRLELSLANGFAHAASPTPVHRCRSSHREGDAFDRV